MLFYREYLEYDADLYYVLVILREWMRWATPEGCRDACGRVLIYVPVWHSRVDMGLDRPAHVHHDPEREKIRQALRRVGDKFWEAIEIYWDLLESSFSKLSFTDWGKVRVFSDSVFFGISPLTMGILHRLAEAGSRHFRLIIWLLGKGANLEITEDKKFFIGPGKTVVAPGFARTQERDKAVANNISTSLKNGEVGILILGASHQDWRHDLDQDIEIRTLLRNNDIRELKKRWRALSS